tara:strand:+ start:174 stop:695 length:522 start_codon:yes stop_codon:yes gene_type:complete
METKIIENIIFYQIPDFPTYYVSLCSKIYSEKSDKILKDYFDKDGYFKKHLFKDGKTYPKRIHRLLAEMFIPNPANKPCVDHKNRIRTDNTLENLQWATLRENAQNRSKKATTLFEGVYYFTNKNRYVARWNDENSKPCAAGFSINKYGLMFALLMAINKREEMVKLLYNRSE